MATQSATVTVSIQIASLLTYPATVNAPNGVVNQAYSFQLPSPTGGIPPYSFSGSSLPSGWSVSSAGLITGTPSSSGQVSLSITVSDAG